VLASFFGVFFIMSLAAGYEIIEWWYAVAEGGEAGLEFLGSQGDIWDAQKDMLSDTLGALSVTVLFWRVRPDRRFVSGEPA
jgi:putative membrane protein